MNLDYQYLVGRIQSTLATDLRTNKQDVKIMIRNGRVHLLGQTSTDERRRAIAEVVAEVVPDMEVRNELKLIELSDPTEPEVISG